MGGVWKVEELFVYSEGAADFFVRGEGEAAMVSLLQILGQGGDLADVPNLIWRSATGETENVKRGLLDLGPLPYSRVGLDAHGAISAAPALGGLSLRLDHGDRVAARTRAVFAAYHDL